MERKQLLKSLYRSIVLCVVLLFNIVFVTVAWFANNRNVSSGGMKTQINVSNNLVIASDPSDLPGNILAGTPFLVTFTEDETVLDPARHKDDVSYPVLLEYNTNPRVVSPTTGLKAGSIALQFDKVPVYSDELPKRYYIDYTVYIASTGSEFMASDLNATMDLIADDEMKDYMYAASIDFYIDTDSSDGVSVAYKGTLNKAGKNWENDGSGLTSINLLNSDITIPLNTSGDYITVVMRCYFDGGLEKEANQTYVYSEGLVTGGYVLKANFEAIDKE